MKKYKTPFRPEPFESGEGKSFSPEQLRAIFGGDFFTRFIENGAEYQFAPNHTLRPCYFWSPILALYHGARSGEILQLKTANVFERDNVTVIRLEGMVKNQLGIAVVGTMGLESQKGHIQREQKGNP